MKLNNIRVYGLQESILASAYPMMGEVPEDDMKFLLPDKNDMERAARLAQSGQGTGHDNFLSGIIVQLDVTASNAWWLQMGRYHFVQIVSSQSKMHRLKAIAKEKAFSDKLPASAVKQFLKMYYSGTVYTEEELIYSCPLGLELTARITTNYRQLKTIYAQRKHHKLQEWRDFCAFIESLPHTAEWFTQKG